MNGSEHRIDEFIRADSPIIHFLAFNGRLYRLEELACLIIQILNKLELCVVGTRERKQTSFAREKFNHAEKKND